MSTKILIISDAGRPQVNGVVNTLATTIEQLHQDGFRMCWVQPNMVAQTTFTVIKQSFYPEVDLVAPTWKNFQRLKALIQAFDPTFVHISVEGPLGLMGLLACRQLGLKFTTCFHTDWAQVMKRFWVPEWLTWKYLSWFHGHSSRIMVATNSVADILRANGIQNLHTWSRGVDLEKFSPKHDPAIKYDYALCVSRLSHEKNLEDFLRMELPLPKVVVGDGPHRAELQARFPEVDFRGVQHGTELAQTYAGAKVFVFPSKADTFGLVVLEALASGVPVVAYDVPGPKDILVGKTKTDLIIRKVGGLAKDFKALEALARYFCDLDRCEAPRKFAENFSWYTCTNQFITGLERSK